MERRAFIGTLAGGLLAAPLAVGGQQAGKVYRIGLLDYAAPDPARQVWWNAFRQQMRDLGYVEGQNVTFEPRWAQGDDDRLPKLAAELVGLKVDLIVTGGQNAALAAKRATATIPIVTATGTDPMALGLAASLRQPGGNVTGMTSISSELASKRLELLRIVAPRASRIAILWDERNPASHLSVDGTEAAAKPAGLTIHSVPVRSPAEIEAAFATLVRDRAGALIIVPSPAIFSHRKRLVELAMKHRLPTVVGSREYVEAGGLASYGPDYPDQFRHAALHVDKILKGAKPGDLPIEQPTKFELVINLKTAKTLGLTIPPSVLAGGSGHRVNAPADHLMSWLRGAAIGVVLILGVSSSALAAKRIELYDAKGQHQGHAMVQPRAGRVDYYDLRDRRIGWGRAQALSERYRVDLFAADGQATGYALADREAGRVDFFDTMSRRLGSGVLDKRGRVTTFDVSGRRRTDTALSVQKVRPASWSPPSD